MTAVQTVTVVCVLVVAVPCSILAWSDRNKSHYYKSYGFEVVHGLVTIGFMLSLYVVGCVLAGKLL